MKRALITLALGLAAQGVWADDYKYLAIYDKNGNATDIELATLQRITFTATDMVVKTSDGENTFALADLLKMAFAQEPTPVDGIQAATEGLLQYAGGELTVGAEAKGQILALYAQNGALLSSQKVGKSGASLSITQLPKGVYIVRVGKTAVKIVK